MDSKQVFPAYKPATPLPMNYKLSYHALQSSRLSTKLASTSTTPRTGRHLAEEIARDVGRPHEELLYEEGKLCLSRLDVERALELFMQCPAGYRNRESYVKQCNAYIHLCKNGVVHRARTEPIKSFLLEVLKEKHTSSHIGRYAELLMEKGYTHESLKRITLLEEEDMFSSVFFLPGHRSSLRSFMSSNTDNSMRIVIFFRKVMNTCLNILPQVKQTARSFRGKKEKGEEDGPHEED